MKTEELQRDPTLAILPSGRAFSVQGIKGSVVDHDGILCVAYFGEEREFVIANPADVAAAQAAIARVGVYVEAPTLKDDDADGDGRTGE